MDARDGRLVSFEMALPASRGERQRLDAAERVGAQGRCFWFSRGRDALVTATKSALPYGGRVLIPAFICPEVISVLRDCGCETALYPVTERLDVDAGVLSKLLRPGDLFVYVRYFGISRPTEAVRCAKSQGAIVLEDSSQAPFCHHSAADTLPDFAFTSMRKYAPVFDGAALDVLNPNYQTTVSAAKFAADHVFLAWRAAALLMRGLYHRRPRRVYAIVAQEFMAGATHRLGQGRIGSRMSYCSRRQLLAADLGAVTGQRRLNYETLVDTLRYVKGIEVLFPQLPTEGCPYGCPVIVPGNRLWRDALRERGIQGAILWDCDDHWKGFPASQWLAEHLLVLPVAQTNTPDDMRRVGAVLKEYDGD